MPLTWHLPDRNREDPTLIAPLTAEPSMAIKTAEDLFIHELSDIYSAEKQLTKALHAWPVRPRIRTWPRRLETTWKRPRARSNASTRLSRSWAFA